MKNQSSLILVQKYQLLDRFIFYVQIYFSNLTIWSGCIQFFSPGHVPGDISWEIFPKHFVARDNSWDANCPRRCPGIGWYSFTFDDTDSIGLYKKGFVCYGLCSATYVFVYPVLLSRSVLGETGYVRNMPWGHTPGALQKSIHLYRIKYYCIYYTS